MARNARISTEKPATSHDTTMHLETAGKYIGSHSGLDDSNQPSYDDVETKRILRKVDYRLLPVLTVLYVLSYLDRSNIGNARVAGMNADLELTGTQYNIALMVFFFPYAFFEIPSNIVLKIMRPSYWICILVLSWGTVMTLMGIVQSYEGLVAARTMLGATEAGFFPAASYLLTIWYCRFEVQTRLSIFFCAASFAAAFSGLLAFGIQHMDGVAGLGGWRWIFILEGIFTVVVGVFIPWTLPDSPDTASFLTQEERDFIRRRLEQDAGTAAGKVDIAEKYKWTSLKAALTDWKIYVFVLIFWGNSICNVGFLYTAPTIILELGYSAAHAQLLTVPIYTVGIISTLTFSFLADRSQSRWQFIVIPFSITIVGYIGLISIPHPGLPGLTYAFLFFIPAGIYPPLIGATSWVANNLAPSWKRAVGMALFISIGNLMGAVGSNIFLQNQAPHYWLGYGFGIGILVVSISAALVLKVAYTKINKQRDAMSVEEIRGRYTEEELLDMGDKSPLYRYVV